MRRLAAFIGASGDRRSDGSTNTAARLLWRYQGIPPEVVSPLTALSRAC